ncbi:hypothetical protein [Nonomuraea recticatena]|uniref:hypothetical protein n=1 Tax=Nonomuraea recticatena TaxID=46178 RepID=UPI00362298B2
MDARRHGIAAQPEQSFDPEGDAEGGQGPLPLGVDEVSARAERRARGPCSFEVDPDLHGSGSAATPARGLPDRQVEADVRCARGEGEARHVEDGDALAGQDGAVDTDHVRLRVTALEPGEDAVTAHQPRRGDGRPALQIRYPRGPADVCFVEYGADPDGVDPVELPGRVQRREDDETGEIVAGHQDRCPARPLGARDDLRCDVHQTAGDAEVGQPAALRVAQPVQAGVPHGRDHR